MYNELFHIGPFTVYGYGLMIGIGILVAYFTAEKRAKKRGENHNEKRQNFGSIGSRAATAA